MSDIVERLRAITGQAGDHGDVQLCGEAADEIERLRAENALLKESAEKLYDIAASGAEPSRRRRMLDCMADESFAEYG